MDFIFMLGFFHINKICMDLLCDKNMLSDIPAAACVSCRNLLR